MGDNYKIINIQLGQDKHSKVYFLTENNSRNKYIVKIYENSKYIFYENETNILSIINNIYENQENKYFLMFNNIQYTPNMFQIPGEVTPFNLKFLFYDYLPKLSLLDYISQIGQKIKEIHAKFLCHEILTAIQNWHMINICHNKIDIQNVMFDENFNLKIIHFCEAILIDDINKGYKLNVDLFQLGQVLAKILTLGKFKSIGIDKNTKKYVVFGNFPKSLSKDGRLEESMFWSILSSQYNIDVSQQFLDFFHVLIKSKKSKELIDIDILLKNKWLNEVINAIPKYKEIFKNDFKYLYETIMENKEITDKINIDIKNFIDEYENEVCIINDNKLEEDYNKYGSDYSKDKFSEPNINLNNNINNPNKNKENLNEKNITDNLNKLSINDEKYFKPRKDEFNYLEINIENKENKDINEAINTFIQDLKIKIIEKHEDKGINVEIKEEKGTSFKIIYEIEPKNFGNIDIEFLDEHYEKKIKNVQKFEIKVELIEGNKDLITLKKIYQYYLFFNGITIDKEDFYEILKFLKEIAKAVLLNE